MTRPTHRQEDPTGNKKQVHKKGRPLADGPAVRRALAQAEADAKSGAGWKLLEGPIDSSPVSEVSGLLQTVDDTQPEPSWTVVAVVDEPMPTNNADSTPTPANSQTPAASIADQPRSNLPLPSPALRRARPPAPQATAPAAAALPAPLAATARRYPTPAQMPMRRVTPAQGSSMPIPRPRSMMATQMGVAPPPPPLEPPRAPARSAAVTPARVHPARDVTQLDAELPTRRCNPALAKTSLDASSVAHQHHAFADTQLASPRPPELEGLLDAHDEEAPTVVQLPEFMRASSPPVQAPATLPQTEGGALAVAQSSATARLPAVLPASSPTEALARTKPEAPGAEPQEPRAALPSEAFATTQDTLPPLPMSRAFRIPSVFERWPRKQLIAVGSVAAMAALLPLGAAGLFLASRGSPGDRPNVATQGSHALPTIVRKPPAPHLRQIAPQAARVPRAAGGASRPPTESPREPAPPPRASTTPAPASTIPWLDRPATSTPSCDSLASARPGPKGFLLQQAMKQGQRELVRGNVKEAHTAFCEAMLLGTPHDTILMGLTQVLLLQSDTDTALGSIDQLLARKPTDRPALELRGDILIRLGRADEAREAWYRAAGASRASASLIDNLRRLNRTDAAKALKAGDLGRADRLWRRVIALDVHDVAACAELAAVLARNGEVAAARRWLEYGETLDSAHTRLTAVKNSLDG